MSSPVSPDTDVRLELSQAVRDTLERHRRGVSPEECVNRIRHPEPGRNDFRTGTLQRRSEHGEHSLEFGIDALYATANDNPFHHQSWDKFVERLDVTLWERLESGHPLTARDLKDAVMLTNAGAHPGIRYRGSIRIPVENLPTATAALASLVTDLEFAPDGGLKRVFDSLMPSGGTDEMAKSGSPEGYYFRQTLTGVEAYDEIILKILAPYLSEMSALEAHLGARSYWHLGLDGGLLVANDRDLVMARFDEAMQTATEGLRFEKPIDFVADSIKALDKKARQRAGGSPSDASVAEERRSFVMFLSAGQHQDPEMGALQKAYLANWRQQAQRYVAGPTVQFGL